MSEDPCKELQEAFLKATNEWLQKANQLKDIGRKEDQNGITVTIIDDIDELTKFILEEDRARKRYFQASHEFVECMQTFHKHK